jgi:lipopolysaccharide/colanic/teichoic acid biosynthesis glycosyltransferase
MKIIILGASGFIGKELIPLLSDHELVIVGHTTRNLTHASGITYVFNYEDLKKFGRSADIFVNIEIFDNNLDTSEKAFFDKGSYLPVEFLQTIKNFCVDRYINFSNISEMDDKSKIECMNTENFNTTLLVNILEDSETIYFSHVYSQKFSGRLAILNILPTSVAKLIFYAFSALKPTTNVETLARYIVTSKAADIIPIDSGEFAAVDSKSKNWCFRVSKRAIDLAFVSVVFGLFWWLLILFWVAIRMQSDGPPIFRQVRLGRDEVPFICYKFRTMKVGTEEVGTHEVAPTSVTPIGRFLRRTKLDELPQILNILKNEMTLVGPRPCLPSQTELIDERRYRKVFSSIPGISGLAQINGVDMRNPKLLARWDAKYLATQGLILDLWLIMKTLQKQLWALSS